MTLDISQRAVLAIPTIRTWSARRRDRVITQEVHEAHGVDAHAGNYNKCLIDRKAPSYAAVITIATDARKYHYEHSLPWSISGACIVATEMYEEYATAMERFRKAFDAAIDELIRDYPNLLKKARQSLNGMFREDDYPSAVELKRSFGFEVRFFAVPSKDDFRVKLGDADVAAIKNQIERDTKQAVQFAQKDRWNRLSALVSNIADVLGRDGTVRDALVDNARHAVETLPKLALSDDSNFDQLLAEVKAKLTPHHPQSLRDDDVLKKKVADEAKALARKIARYAA